MNKEICDKCGEIMVKMTECHLFCPNCGSHLDCSDKSHSNNGDTTW